MGEQAATLNRALVKRGQPWALCGLRRLTQLSGAENGTAAAGKCVWLAAAAATAVTMKEVQRVTRSQAARVVVVHYTPEPLEMIPTKMI